MSSRVIRGLGNWALVVFGLFALGYLLVALLPIGPGGYRIPDARFSIAFVEPGLPSSEVLGRVKEWVEGQGYEPLEGQGEENRISPRGMLRTRWASLSGPHVLSVNWQGSTETVSSVKVIFRKWSPERFQLDDWLAFFELRDTATSLAFPDGALALDRHPARFTESWSLRTLSEHFDEPLPEREATRLHCWEQLSGFQQFLRRDLGYGVGAPEHWVLEQARKRVERTTGLDLLAWTDTPASQRCGGHQLDQINLLAYGVGLAFVLPLFWLIWRLAGLARAGLGERRVLFVTIGTLLLMPVGLPLDLNWYWVPQIVAMWHLHSRDYALFMDWLNFEYNLYFTLAVLLPLLLVAWRFRERGPVKNAPADQGGS